MSAKLIEGLQNPALYNHPIKSFKVKETHASWVILTGDYAYKIKKPVDFKFLDFSTLERRRQFCHEEIRLNKRTAPSIYLNVITITGSEDNPEINGNGEPIEYAVKMAQFPQSKLTDFMLDNEQLEITMMNDMACKIALFHQSIPAASDETHFGGADEVHDPVVKNFTTIRPLLSDSSDVERLDRLQQWADQAHQRLKPIFAKRKKDGFIRECHGDIHLGNMAYIYEETTLFDCIEFNPDLSWIDTMSDIGFLIMDLEKRDLPNYAYRLLNAYLEITGDYQGLAILKYYKAYRAMVRAKVAILRLNQPNLSETETTQILADYHAYIELAERYAQPTDPALSIMHGYSGSGKTFVSQQLLETLPAIRIRSDIERKRLFNIRALESSHDNHQNIYTEEANEATFNLLCQLANHVVDSGLIAIIDATFLKESQRKLFEVLANNKNIPYFILHCETTLERAKAWIEQRHKNGQDASEATVEVLEQQTEHAEPLTSNEKVNTLEILNNGDSLNIQSAVDVILKQQATRNHQLKEPISA